MVWMIIAGILLFLLVLLLLPVHLYATFQGELLVRVRYLFLSRQLLPAKKKKTPAKTQTADKKRKKTNEEKETPSFARMLKEDGVSAVLAYYRELAAMAATAAKKLLRTLVVDRLDVCLRIASDDPADTAVNYGRACAAVYPAQAVLETVIRVRKRTVQVVPDFLQEKGEVTFDVRVHVTPLRVIGAAIGFFIQYLVYTVKQRQADDMAAAN